MKGLSKNLKGYEELKNFVESLEAPRAVVILVKAGAPVDDTIKGLCEFMQPGDIIIDGTTTFFH